MDKPYNPLRVIGHKNPDTDSVCAAVAYARLKSDFLGEPAVAYRAGNINAQTEFVLSRFGIESPEFLADVYPRLSDIMIGEDQLITLKDTDSLGKAQDMLIENRFSFLPVVDPSGRYCGQINTLKIVGLFRDLALAGSGEGAGTRLRSLFDPPNSSAVTDGATPLEMLQKAVQACRGMPIADLIEREHVTFKPDDLVRRVQRQIGRYNEGGFMVVDDQGYPRGVITRINFLDHSRFRVVMVDHNEFTQAVDGIEEAEVVEIIDHHRLGNDRSDAPITFINKVVGSTSTIIAELYETYGFRPDAALCGIMLAAILSDTVILKSPTTTNLDRQMAQWLTSESGIDPEAFGEEMFRQGGSLKDLPAHDIILQDRKTYTEEDWKFSISQIEVIGFKGFFDRKSEFQEALQSLTRREQNSFSGLIVTDITEQASILLIHGSRLVIDSISYPEIMEGFFEMKGVISRKKQVIPYLLDILRNL